MWWEHVKGCRCCNRKGHMYACGLSFACLFAAILQYPMHTFAWICRDEITEKEPGKKAVLFTTGGKQKSASSGIHQVLRCGKQKGWLNFLDFPILLNFLVRTISAYRCSLTIIQSLYNLKQISLNLILPIYLPLGLSENAVYPNNDNPWLLNTENDEAWFLLISIPLHWGYLNSKMMDGLFSSVSHIPCLIIVLIFLRLS
jgi:hypothetical protein